MNTSIPYNDVEKIVRLYVDEGQSINHITFLMNFKYNVDDVNQILREHIKALEASVKAGLQNI